MPKKIADKPDHWSDIVGMPDVVCVPLTRGKKAIIDRDDIGIVVGASWHYEHGYARSDARHGKKYMHRIINNTPDNMLTDHINGNTLDNRRRNLRSATHAENAQNARATRRYKGVSFHRQTGKWRARIMVDYREISLGLYGSQEEAYKHYIAAAKKYQGKFARI